MPAAPIQALPSVGLVSQGLEFLLVGGGTLVLLPLAFALRARLGLDDAEFIVGFLTFHAANVINNPHFAVTYLLFYKDVRERALGRVFGPVQRARYIIAGFVVPLALAAFAIDALRCHSALRLGWMFQLMFFLVGWHYVKQGFGVVSVLSLRRGVRYSTLERRVVLFHCFAAWLCARGNPRDLGRESSVDDVVYTSLRHPPGLDVATRVLFLASSVALGIALLRKWRRERRPPPLVPLVGLLVTVWLWVLFSHIDPLLVYVIPALHSLQYLYFVWLLKRNEARASAGPPEFKSVPVALFVLSVSSIALGWLLFRGAPAYLDGLLVLRDPSDPLGETPYLAAIGCFVNLHHYFMDTVIWRRENPSTRFLST